MDNFYMSVLYNLSSVQKVLPAAVYEKESALFAAKWWGR